MSDRESPLADLQPDLPAGRPDRWQESLDAIASIGEVQTVLVSRLVGEQIEIVVANAGNNRQLRPGDQLSPGEARCVLPVLTCSDVWHVRDVRLDPQWATTPSADNDPVSIIGLPLRRPDGTVFGALCALDNKPNDFPKHARTLMTRIRRAMEVEHELHEENLRLQREIAAHEETARALRVSKKLHEEAQRIAKLGHWHHDLESGELVWSDELFRIREIDESRVPPSYAAFLDLVHPDDRQALNDTFNRSVAERREFQFDYRLLMRDGRIKWMAAHSATLYDDNGKPLSSSGTTQDITERKEAEHALRESEALHRTAQSLAQIGHWQLDLANEKLSWSEELFRIFEIDQDKFSADYEAFLQLVHPDDRAALHATYTGSVINRTDYNFEHRLLMPDGRIKWIIERAVTNYAADGTPLFSVGTTQDITVRKEAARERDMLAHIVAELGEMVFIGDLAGNIVYANDAVRRRIAPDGLTLPVNALTIIVPELHPLVTGEIIPRLLAGGTWQGELSYRVFGSDQRVDAHVLAFGIRDATSGALSRIVNVSLDLTEQKAAEQERAALERQLLHVQKLESLGVMAGGIAHDFNNILQAIIGNLELITPARVDDRQSQEALLRARQAAIRAVDITRQLLTFAGHDIQPRQRVDLGELMEESANLMRTVIDKRIHLRIIPPPCRLPVDAVPGQVQQVLMNLVSNAAESIADGRGAMVVSCGRLAAGSPGAARLPQAGAAPATDMAWLEVQDTGQGMDSETQARMFDPFFTSKVHGRGLGMASVLGIVRAHDGTIEVDSEPGRGTTMRILLPLSRVDAAIVKARTVTQPATTHKGRILLVDDDMAIRMVGEALLSRRGFSVTCAAGGAEAIALLRDNARQFECVILDLTMPGVDGAEVFQFLRAHHPSLPVLLASGFDRAEALRRIRISDNTAFIRKPWLGEDLFNALDQLLNSAT